MVVAHECRHTLTTVGAMSATVDRDAPPPILEYSCRGCSELLLVSGADHQLQEQQVKEIQFGTPFKGNLIEALEWETA